MASDKPPSNPRFTSQTKTAEDLLSTQTVGLVALSDFRKRRAEVNEQKERDLQDALANQGSGLNTPTSDSASTPLPIKKKKRKLGTAKLSFGLDDDEEPSTSLSDSKATAGAGAGSEKIVEEKRKLKANPSSVLLAPRPLTKAAKQKEVATRDALRKEFLVLQEAIKAQEILIPFVFYDGTNIPGGVCRIRKGDFVWVFLDRSRKVGADLGVGEKVNSTREWARVGVDDLMLVRGTIILPHHYDFYYFIINHTLGPNNRLLFDYSSEPSLNTSSESSGPRPSSLDSKPPAKGAADTMGIEGADDDPTYTKVVDRRWYERNKHIFPASVWQEFDQDKDYQKEVKRDLGGNAFFFS